jgi:hypothetical protein
MMGRRVKHLRFGLGDAGTHCEGYLQVEAGNE